MEKPKQQPIEEIKSLKDRASDIKLQEAIADKAKQIGKPVQK